MKRVTSINFKGVSRLPPEKSSNVLTALDNISACIVQTFDSLEDPKLGPAEKQEQLVSFSNLGKELDILSQYAVDEYGACDKNFQNQVSPVKSKIQSDCSQLQASFGSFDPSDQRELRRTFESLLSVLENVIEMFKSSERNTVFNIGEMIDSLSEIAGQMARSTKSEDINIDIENSRAVGQVLYKGIRDRAAVLKEKEIGSEIVELCTDVERDVSSLVSACQNDDSTRGSKASRIQSTLGRIKGLLQETRDQCFINFEVDYTDDPVVVALQKLSASALREPPSTTNDMKEDALQKMSQRMAQSRSGLGSYSDTRATEIKNACAAMQDLMPILERDTASVTSKDYNSQREKFITAYNDLNKTIQLIKEQVVLLPLDAVEHFKESTALLDAAGGFLKGLEALSQALPDN